MAMLATFGWLSLHISQASLDDLLRQTHRQDMRRGPECTSPDQQERAEDPRLWSWTAGIKS